MNNQINKEEKELARRMREHEFTFDASALAGFESLLAAEDAVAGKPAPVVPPSVASEGASRKLWVSLLALILVAGAGLAGWYWQTVEEVVARETPSVATVEHSVATESREAEGAAPAAPGITPASIQNTAPAPRRPESSNEATAALPAPAFTPVAQPTTLIRRPLPMPRTGETGQAPPRPMPVSGRPSARPIRSRTLTVQPLPSMAYRVTYDLDLPQVALVLSQKEDWRP